MVETADALKDDIEARRHAMTQDVDELEQRARSMTDWRQQINERPMLALGVAAAGGMLLGFLTGGSGDKDRARTDTYSYGLPTWNGGDSDRGGWITGERGPSYATEAGKDRAASKVDEIRGALMGLATTKAEEFLKEVLPGFRDEVSRVQEQSEAAKRDRDDQTPSTTPRATA